MKSREEEEKARRKARERDKEAARENKALEAGTRPKFLHRHDGASVGVFELLGFEYEE